MMQVSMAMMESCKFYLLVFFIVHFLILILLRTIHVRFVFILLL
jgi:hypothetical protein